MLEVHGMWTEGKQLHENSYFSDVYARDSDKVLRARLERFLGRIELETGHPENALVYEEKIRELRQSVDPEEKSAKETINDLLKVEKDLSLWRHVRSTYVKGAVLRDTLLKMEALKITPLHELALLAFENHHSELSLKLVHDAIAATPSDVMPNAVYTYILVKSGQKSKLWTSGK
jgi:hypothetical protein